MPRPLMVLPKLLKVDAKSHTCNINNDDEIDFNTLLKNSKNKSNNNQNAGI